MWKRRGRTLLEEWLVGSWAGAVSAVELRSWVLAHTQPTLERGRKKETDNAPLGLSRSCAVFDLRHGFLCWDSRQLPPNLRQKEGRPRKVPSRRRQRA